MNLKQLSLFVISALTILGCSKAEEETAGGGLRWMDRKIYLAVAQNSDDPDRNNVFQKETLREALNEISELTDLGGGYFEFIEVNESTLNPNLSAGEMTNENDRSFIQVWPDAVFNDWVQTTVGGNLPDPHAVSILNASNKRQFFIIMKASCFSNGSGCGGIGVLGVRALIARQLSLISGAQLKDCATYPSDVMCSTPADSQWTTSQKYLWKAYFNNLLEVIKKTPGYYDQVFL